MICKFCNEKLSLFIKNSHYYQCNNCLDCHNVKIIFTINNDNALVFITLYKPLPIYTYGFELSIKYASTFFIYKEQQIKYDSILDITSFNFYEKYKEYEKCLILV